MNARPAAACSVLALVLTACSGGGRPTAFNTPVATGSPAGPSTSPSASPTPSPAGLVSPLTGLPVPQLGRVVAIKVDNAPLARPQSGLDRADVVYEELVEGGSTRFLAIYSSQHAPVIGPVRSVRESDIELLSAYGPVLFAYSGGNAGVKASVRRSDLQIVSYDDVPGAYWKAGRRRDAINYMTSTANLLAARTTGALAQDVGFRFGAAIPPGRVSRDVTVHWSRAQTSFHYDPVSRRWFRYMDGRKAMLRDGGQMTAPNVIVQRVPVVGSRYTDVTGSRSPYTATTGNGVGLVLRDGIAVPMTWNRAGTGPTRYLDHTGTDIALKPGPVWILLVPTNARVDYS